MTCNSLLVAAPNFMLLISGHVTRCLVGRTVVPFTPKHCQKLLQETGTWVLLLAQLSLQCSQFILNLLISGFLRGWWWLRLRTTSAAAPGASTAATAPAACR